MASLLRPPGSALSLESFGTIFGTSVVRHSSISVLGYYFARQTDQVEGKDWLWPSGMLLNRILGGQFLAQALPLAYPL